VAPLHSPANDDLATEARQRFCTLVDSVGVADFARSLHLSTRQVNRIRTGAQPNPLDRLVRCLQACLPEAGDDALAWLCQEAGGFFVRATESIDTAAVSAVREAAEAIAAISDGRISKVDEKEIREAIAALTALLMHVRAERARAGRDAEIVITQQGAPPTAPTQPRRSALR